jgi:hypothetical protein
MDQGRIVEQGSHGDLLRQKGLYKQLHDLHTGMLRRRFRPLASGAATVLSDGSDSRYRVEWLDYGIPSRMAVGKEYSVQVSVRNATGSGWSSHTDRGGYTAPVYVSYHWLHPEGDETVLYDGSRTVLPGDVAAGETVDVSNVVVLAPDCPGLYRLQLTLVHEFVAWFEEQGASTLIVPVDVVIQDDESRQPFEAPEHPLLAALERP